ncbi:hypothetical protein BP5796_01397 [Coleophoma crateriformis]|uniref:Xylanolytic transcriptional activator regulatory domain-containing protein n=1 Tax=Coleophoma crateriformis TaxID=565419 RepID=A0A3D8T0A5_9HELO|nr:hypothetical protein BP5796_01397 [Coleophoma crateriformis]
MSKVTALKKARAEAYLSPTPTSVLSTPPVEVARRNSIGDSGPFKKSAGFFGPTNFSAVFLENHEDLGGDIPISSQDSDPSGASHEILQSQTFLMIAGTDVCGSPRIALGAKVIQHLPDERSFSFLLCRYSEKVNECVLHKQSVLQCAASIWTTFGQYLEEPRRSEDFERMSAVLCKNGETGLEEIDDYEEWVASFTGMNMRWETLGAVFTTLGHAILSLPERDPFFCSQRGLRSNRKAWASELKDCVQACVTLSNYGDLINVHMVALLAKNHLFQTIISGDASLVVWRQLGDLASASTALGLHRQVDTAQSTSVVSEWKKLLFLVVFNMDKCASLLTGRPPTLSSRYTHISMPLDLSYQVRIAGGETLAREIARLDENGWNVDGKLYPATTCRAHGRLSLVLDEILELTLGDTEAVTCERINHLLQKLIKTYTSMPRFLQWSPEDDSLPNDQLLWRKIGLRLKCLESKLLLERLLYKIGGSDGSSMIECAKEMLELTVLIWVQRDRYIEHHLDYDYFLMCFGVPASGVLCVELLRRIKQPKETAHLPPIARSEIVQKLSLLIGFLEWVRPAAGNYQLCSRMRQIIKRILDQILNPTPVALPQPETESQTAVEPFDDTPLASTPFSYDDGLDNLDWLNSVDWSRGPWIDLAGPDNYSMDPRSIYLPQG